MPTERCRQPLRNAGLRLRVRLKPQALSRRLSDPEARAELMALWSQLNATTAAQFGPALPEEHRPGGGKVCARDVLCIVPYLANHEYLGEALRSIAEQTITPGRVVLAVDNAQADLTDTALQHDCQAIHNAGIPCEIRGFSGLNGPYFMLNQIVANSLGFSQIWLHDSDDYSHPSRLARQLAFMERHGLDICSCFELRIRPTALELVDYPLQVSRALNHEPGHCMLWPGSLIHRSLWERLNGCSDQYRFGADTEFQLRACFTARMANCPAYLYARRIRDSSLTGSPETGLQSWQRGYITSLYKADYYQRQMLRDAGEPIELQPRFPRVSA
jgi:glycosyltransferase involved in cell wall biosynthesis